MKHQSAPTRPRDLERPFTQQTPSPSIHWGDTIPATWGRYKLLQRIGSGQHTVLYHALPLDKNRGVGTPCVLKILHPRLQHNTEHLGRFIDTAHLWETLNHPNLISFHEFGHVQGDYFIAVDFGGHHTLEDFVHSGPDAEPILSPADVLHIAVGVCRALHHLHTRTDEDGENLHIVHRCVAPRHVLLDIQGTVRLTDFFYTKSLLNQHQTGVGLSVGDMLYMAPEQATSNASTPQVDIFQFGLCLYKALTGLAPFAAQSSFQTYNRILNEPIPRPSRFRSDIPVAMEKILMRMLKRPLKERYPNTLTLGRHLLSLQRKLYPGYASSSLARALSSSRA